MKKQHQQWLSSIAVLVVSAGCLMTVNSVEAIRSSQGPMRLTAVSLSDTNEASGQEVSSEQSQLVREVISRTQVLFQQVKHAHEAVDSMSVEGMISDSKQQISYEGAALYASGFGQVEQAYVRLRLNQTYYDYYYPNDAEHQVFILDGEDQEWSRRFAEGDYQPQADYRTGLNWLLGHPDLFTVLETQDAYRISVLERDVQLQEFVYQFLGLKLKAEELADKDIYKYMEVSFDKQTYLMTDVHFRFLDPSGEVSGHFQFHHANQLKSSDFDLPKDAQFLIDQASATSSSFSQESDASSTRLIPSQSGIRRELVSGVSTSVSADEADETRSEIEEGQGLASQKSSSSSQEKLGRHLTPQWPKPLYQLASLQWAQPGLSGIVAHYLEMIPAQIFNALFR